MRYRSKPADVEAMQWAWGTDQDRDGGSTAAQIVAWVNANGGEAEYHPNPTGIYLKSTGNGSGPYIAVRTINGPAYAAPGHYVVMGSATFPTQGHDGIQPVAEHVRDFYPCDPKTFEKRWEPIS